MTLPKAAKGFSVVANVEGVISTDVGSGTTAETGARLVLGLKLFVLVARLEVASLEVARSAWHSTRNP